MISSNLRQEAGKTYLAIKNETETAKEYLISMITKNQIEGLLSCKIAYDQTQKMLYYDVTNKISLEHLYKEKSLSCKEIRRLFDNLAEIKKRGQEYLLEEEYYLFDPDYIYVDMETDSLQIMYVPFGSEESGQYKSFAEFLLKKVEQSDTSAVKLAYMFYKMTSLETFSLEGFSALVDKEMIMSQKPEEIREMVQDKQVDIQEQEDNADECSGRVSFLCPIILFIGSIGTVVTFIIMRQKTVYAMYILIVAIIISISFVISLIRTICRILDNSRDEDMQNMGGNYSIEEYWGDEDTQVFFDNDVTGEDTFIKKEYYLKWEENGVAKQYKIKTFPIVIGKLKGEVDCLINEPSVSRIHGRLLKEGENIYIEDLNSRNGVFCDEKRLQPGQRALFNSESKVKLGNVICEMEVKRGNI